MRLASNQDMRVRFPLPAPSSERPPLLRFANKLANLTAPLFLLSKSQTAFSFGLRFGWGKRWRIWFAKLINPMVDPRSIHGKLINLLDANQVEYKLFNHPVALTYEDLAIVQKSTGFFGTEAKCMVLKVDDKFIVYVTLQGSRVNFDSVKKELGGAKVWLATADDLAEYFGAQPGCAYPFAFDSQYDIYVDPKIYEQGWLLFSPVLPTETIQAKGEDLRRVFGSLDNQVSEVTNFNQ